MSKNLLVSVSGGRSSAMMAYHIHTNPKYDDYNKVFVFANTGLERPQTIAFLKNIVEVWGVDLVLIEGRYSEEKGIGISHQVVSFDDLAMRGEPFEGAVKQKNKGIFSGLPNSAAPYCSSALKSLPIKSFARSYFNSDDYLMAIGFRLEDMPKRITWPEIYEDKKRIFPLLTDFDLPISLYHIHSFFEQQPFKLSISSIYGNCSVCWKKSEKGVVANILFEDLHSSFVKGLEGKYGNTMYRERKSIDYFLNIARTGPAQLSLFPDDEHEGGCVCSL